VEDGERSGDGSPGEDSGEASVGPAGPSEVGGRDGLAGDDGVGNMP